MKIALRVALVILLFVVHLAIAQPSLADRPKPTKTPDYIELTKSLNNLLAQTELQTDNAELQQQIDELQLQKALMESGMNWGQCSNQTGKTLAIYGPKESSQSAGDNTLYFLADRTTTPDGWDCNGIYLPKGVKVAGVDVTQPLAYRILDGTRLVAQNNPETDELVLNAPPASLLKTGEKHWLIPDVSQAFIESRVPSSLTAGEIED